MSNALRNVTRAQYERVNVSLPASTLRLLKSVAAKRNRSGFIDQAVRFYVGELSRANLKKRMSVGAAARAPRDLALAEDWFALEDEIWQKREHK